MLPNHHITKPVFIGEIQADGQFDVVWKTDGPGARRRMVEGARRLQGPGRPTGSTSQVRQLQHQDQQVRQLSDADCTLTWRRRRLRRLLSTIPGTSNRIAWLVTNAARALAVARLAARCSLAPCRACRRATSRRSRIRRRLLQRYRCGHRRRRRQRQSAGGAGHRGAAGRPPAVQRRRQEGLHRASRPARSLDAATGQPSPAPSRPASSRCASTTACAAPSRRRSAA